MGPRRVRRGGNWDLIEGTAAQQAVRGHTGPLARQAGGTDDEYESQSGKRSHDESQVCEVRMRTARSVPIRQDVQGRGAATDRSNGSGGSSVRVRD